MKLCSVEGCSGKHKARGLCMKHYQRRWHHVAPGKTDRLARNRAWKAQHPERRRNDQVYEAKQRAELSDRYMRELLNNDRNHDERQGRSRLSKAQIPGDLIEAKRTQIQIVRFIRSFRPRITRREP
jgi:hypothetical protein